MDFHRTSLDGRNFTRGKIERSTKKSFLSQFQTIPSFNSRIIEASEDTFVTVAEIDLDPRTFVREMHLADGDLLAYKTSDNVFRFRSVAEAGKRVLPDVAAPEATSRLCLTDFGLVVTRPGARVAIVWHWLDVLKVRL